MFRQRVFLAWLVVLVTILPSYAETFPLKLATYSSHVTQHENTLNMGKCPSLDSFSSPDNQVLLEFYFLCNALKQGGIDASYKFYGFPVVTRALKEMVRDDNLLPSFALWQSNVDDENFITTSPVMKRGTFHKGIYVLATRDDLLLINTFEQLKSFTAISNEHWNIDNQALNCLTDKITFNLDYQQMYRQVSTGKADFVLKSFPRGDNLDSTLYNAHLAPIPNLKVSMEDALVFAIPKKHRHAKKLKNAINKGLNQLRENKLIKKYYQEAGVMHPKTKDWQLSRCR